MAASDKPLRDQKTLDIVFAVSSILMLISSLMMYAQDYFREWKPEQRVFREVESKLAQRMAIEQLPSDEEIDAAEDAVVEARKVRDSKQPEVAELKKKLAELEPAREKANASVNDAKSEVGSKYSFYYIALEHRDNEAAASLLKQITELQKVLDKEEANRDAIEAKMKAISTQIDAIDADVTNKIGALKKLNDKFDAMVNMSIKKEWTWRDSFRSWPIIEGFAPPTKIQQITNNDYGINYNFKDVTRFDRCTTCHLGIDRPAYTKARLKSLTEVTSSQEDDLKFARQRLDKRRFTLRGLPEAAQVPDSKELRLNTLAKSQLTESRINEFAAHPRLDLFVGADSKHPMEKFGCTTCHNGQGSGTSFHWASHTPNDSLAEKKWTENLAWSHIHYGDWEFPMTPKRFAESNCLKCHHQVTDLISSDNRNEAPKLLRGYNLIRENGCFGCHEIAGRKSGKQVGPDMRLESTPPLVDLPPAEQVRIESDLENRPGNLRKVGPSLYRLSEKTTEEFTRKWLRAPREFRPDTKMPHFYGTSNNSPEHLPNDQKEFPDAEIHAVAHYLFKVSNSYIKDIEKNKGDAAEAQQKDLNTVLELASAGKLTDAQKKTMEDAQRRIRLRKATTLEDLTGGYAGDTKKGRVQFIERGCLSCHVHQATEKADGDSPAVFSEALFGPNLSQVAAKLGKAESAKVWLVQWLLDPAVHSPRTRMPVTHLTPNEATDIAAWLLAQPGADFGANWNNLQVPASKTEDLENLAKVYLTRLMSKSQMNEFFEKKTMPESLANDLPAEEREFVQTYKASGDDALKHFVGKRAVGRLGCYACHDIPGFDSARPIGVGLNDWGKKDANKLAFEDIANFFRAHFYPIEKWTDDDNQPIGRKIDRRMVDGKEVEVTLEPVEAFFADALLKNHGNREGYLDFKLRDPRSYDFNRVRAWDDRARMPQFKFSRSRRKAGENDKDFEARGLKEEAEAREAVATFVLGLLGEAVPTNMTNRPTGDRLAEIKGRQTLDAFNCAGCHLIRSGTFEVKSKPSVFDRLAIPAKAKRPGDHNFPGHANWNGRLSPENITIHGILPQPMSAEDEATGIRIRLMEALRIVTPEKVQADIPAATTVEIPAGDFVYPAPGVLESPEKTKQFLKDRGQYGGTFADLLVGYLERKDPKAFPKDSGIGDSSKARPLAPPSLVGQGERTQPEWLYEFLLNPYPVRKMTVLRMPKFSLSSNDAQTLVDYFAAVERQRNPGIGLTYPYEQIKQQDAASTAYFRQKSEEYVARLKAAKVPGGKDQTMFDKRIEELTPIWQAALKDLEGQKDKVKAGLDAANEKYNAAEAKEKEAQAKVDAAKGKKNDAAALAAAEAEYKAVKAELDGAARGKEGWERASTELTSQIADSSVDKQKKEWIKNDAYLTDAFKLVLNKDLCMKCHQINGIEVKNDVQGPPLTNIHKRLRPGWTERWIAHPDRFLPYASSMPVNFPKDAPDQFKEFFAGTPLERVQAVRDVLMVLPQASQISANRYWMLPPPGDAK